MENSEQQDRSTKNIKILKSEDIFTGSKEVVIQHNNSLYRLIITKSGKLILNK